MSSKVLGIVGGGQLGRMLTMSAKSMGFGVACLDPTPNCPAAQVGAEQILGGLSDKDGLAQLFEIADVVTWEIEHIDVDALQVAADSSGTVVRPAISDLRMIQDKLIQKDHLKKAGIAVADFFELTTAEDIQQKLDEWGGLIVKSRTGGFDGRGNFVVGSPADIEEALTILKGDLYAEKLVPFSSEVAVLVVKGAQGSAIYPPIDTVHQNNICISATVPSALPAEVQTQVEELGLAVADALAGPGLFAIEMFVTSNGVLVNEIAPRVHNSGHLTIEASATSQFENHVRAVLGLALGDTATVVAKAAMVNVLGTKETELDISSVADLPPVKFHWYGKTPVKPARKMGHITAISADPAEDVLELCHQAQQQLDL